MSTPEWRKSSHSGGQQGSDCVELAALTDGIGVRDSKRPEGGNLALTSQEFTSLIDRIKRAELDR
jgi:hypothetical protein